MPSQENLETIFTDVANAIRTKKETTAKIKPVNFADEIISIEGTTKLKNINDYFEPSQPNGGRPFKNYAGTTEDLYQVLNSGGTEGKWTDMQSFFEGSSNITTIPAIDTSNVTSVVHMFNGCSKLTSIPLLDTSNVTNTEAMFNGCTNLKTIPSLDTSKVTSTRNMFNGCSKLTSIPLLDTSNVTNTEAMFNGCSSLTTIPLFDTSKVTKCSGFLNSCHQLKTVPAFNVINFRPASNYSAYLGIFDYDENLEEINIININWGLNIHWSTKMQQPALHKLIDNLLPQTITRTLNLGEVLLPRVSEEYKQKAIDKGWTLK